MDIHEAIIFAKEKVAKIPILNLKRLACLEKLRAQKRKGLVDETVFLEDDQGNWEVDTYTMQKMMAVSIYRKVRSRLFIQYLKEKLKCSKCNEDHPACLDFHHTDSSDKEFSVSKGVLSGKSIDSIITEIKKCIIICSNCHRKHHAESRGVR